MDIFVEQIIKKTTTGKDTALKALICVGAIIVSIACVILGIQFMPINLLLAAGVVYGGYYLMRTFDCEYEYIVTNGEVDIDKIIAKSKRTRLITFKVASFESFGEYKNAPKLESGVTTVLANGQADSEDYYADLKHGTLGNVRIIFTPNEKVLEAMKPFIPRNIRANMNR